MAQKGIGPRCMLLDMDRRKTKMSRVVLVVETVVVEEGIAAAAGGGSEGDTSELEHGAEIGSVTAAVAVENKIGMLAAVLVVVDTALAVAESVQWLQM